MTPALILLALALAFITGSSGSSMLEYRRHHSRHLKHPAPSPRPPPLNDAAVLTCNPADHGGDPSGATDSTDAVQKCMSLLLSSPSQRKMASGITDLGGVTLALGGGTFLVSETLVIPPLVGNIHVSDGTVRASSSFDKGDHLFTIGNSTCEPDQQKSCNEFISFQDVMFDANFFAAGGASVANVMGTTFTSTFFTGFLGTALQIDGGHETMVTDSWFGACYWSDPGSCHDTAADSIAVQINGNDHYLHNVIVFDFVGKGVEVNGEANVLSGVHTWNGGGGGIEVNKGKTRLLGCYLDYNYLLVKGDGGKQLLVVDSFFLVTNIRVEGGVLQDAVFKRNTFSGLQGTESIELDDSDYGDAFGVVVEDNLGEVSRWTRKTLTKELDLGAGAGAGQGEVDFGDVLLLGEIKDMHWSVACDPDVDVAACASVVARKPNGNKVQFAGQPEAGKVSVTVSVGQ